MQFCSDRKRFSGANKSLGLRDIILSSFFMCVFVYTSWGQVEAVPPSGQKVEARPASQFQVIPAEGKPEQRLVKINFDDVDIVLFIKFISEITGRNFLIDPKVKGKVTIVSATELTVEEAYNVFQSVLEVHGFTIVPAGSIIKIVPSAEGRRKNVETQPAR